LLKSLTHVDLFDTTNDERLADRVFMKLIIFDNDGTLVDSEFLCNLGLQQQLAEYGFEYEASELLAKYRGIKLNVTMEKLANKFNTTFPDSFEAEYRLKVAKLFEQQLEANAGVEDLLKSLTIPYCVASSGPRFKIEQALKKTGLSKYFEGKIFSSYEIDSWKPQPDIFLHAAKQMKVDPASCCVVEDSLVGLQAANAANMYSIYYAPETSLKEPSADLQIKHMSELIGKFQ